MTAELATRNGQWIVTPRDTMAVFVNNVVVDDANLAYMVKYAHTSLMASAGFWDASLASATRLRDYAHTSGDLDGDYIAHLLVACSLVAVQRHGDALREIGTLFNAPGVRPVHLWRAMLAHTVRGIALLAQGDDAVDAFQTALDCNARIENWMEMERMRFVLNAAERRLTSAYYVTLRQTLRDALCEVVERLAVMV